MTIFFYTMLVEVWETFLRSCSQSDFAELENILMMSRSTVNVFPLPLHPLEEREESNKKKGKEGNRT